MTDNPQAFPCLDSSDGGLSMRDPGMTLRDYFAGQALAGYAASPAALDGAWRDQTVAACAYEVADAMLEARKAKP